MRVLGQVSRDIGTEGGKVQGAFGIKDKNLRVEVSAEYPIEKVVTPASTAFNAAMDKLEASIPGSWDKPYIEKIKAEFVNELVGLLAEPSDVPA